jgi:hypothetical protein
MSATEEIKLSDMSRILIGKVLGSSEKWVSYYNYMVPLWVVNRGNTMKM